MSDRPYIPRVTCEISHDLHRKLQKHVPHGTLRPLVTALLQMALEQQRIHGTEAFFRIIDGRATLTVSANENLSDPDDRF